MPKSPKDPKEVFSEFVADYSAAFSNDLLTIILYGSAAGKDYRPGESDINFMVVLTEQGIERLDQAFALIKKWSKRGVAIPLFLTESYIQTSLDVFPIEYLNFKREYRVVHGKDLLAELEFDTQFVRLQCEREIKAKLLLLREAYLETRGDAKALRNVVRRSISAFIAQFEALLYLKGAEIPAGKRETAEAACKAFDLNAEIFMSLLDIKAGRAKPGAIEMKELFQSYLKEVRQLAMKVDALGGENE